MNIDLKQLRELMRALKQFDLSEMEIEANGERVCLRRPAPPVPVSMGHAAGFPVQNLSSVPPPPAATAAPAEAAEDPNVVYITSPFVGTFYRAPSPESPNFVEIGQEVKAGQVLCIVEAMKLMNEIEADVAGTLVDVLIDNGRAVEYGERLFKVRKRS